MGRVIELGHIAKMFGPGSLLGWVDFELGLVSDWVTDRVDRASFVDLWTQ